VGGCGNPSTNPEGRGQKKLSGDNAGGAKQLKLDLCPSTDKFGQVATDMHDQTDMLNVVFAGGSHSCSPD
jgi:hypothetical protein